MKIVISSGHGKHVDGANGLIDEVTEARAVVPEIAKHLRSRGHEVIEFHDDSSTTQQQNLQTIVAFHNAQGAHELDISIHFNAYVPTAGGRGTEVLFVNHDIEDVAKRISAAIADCGLIDRGAHHRADLYFLNGTIAPALIVEICFVDAQADVDCYEDAFDAICLAIAECVEPAAPDRPPAAMLCTQGRVSWFGCPNDMGVAPDEGLAFLYDVGDKPILFLPRSPPGTSGLARRLNPSQHYIAMRWDYDVFPKEFLAGDVKAMVRAVKTGREFLAIPADWGPHLDTGRVADISPGLMDALGIITDDVIEVVFPA